MNIKRKSKYIQFIWLGTDISSYDIESKRVFNHIIDTVQVKLFASLTV